MHTETFLLKVTFCFCYLYIHIFILYPDCDTVHAHGTVHSQLSLYLSYFSYVWSHDPVSATSVSCDDVRARSSEPHVFLFLATSFWRHFCFLGV